jgi:hypothetical protein
MSGAAAVCSLASEGAAPGRSPPRASATIEYRNAVAAVIEIDLLSVVILLPRIADACPHIALMGISKSKGK